jgi:SAM-dependent methyltransferase
MNTTLSPEKDPMGHAISQYHATGKAAKLRVFSSLFYEDEIPVDTLFRSFSQMPPHEQEALRQCRGRVLDVGAGSGCHSLELKKRGFEVCSIDISPLSVEVMQQRNLNAQLVNFFNPVFVDCFDTILMAMNGIGIVGRIERLSQFFMRLRQLLLPGGQVLLDSSDISYVFEDDDGNLDIDSSQGYYGEVDYRMQYRNIKGDKFDWLYIDFETLSLYAHNNGFVCEKIADGPHCDYLARLIMK